MDNAEFEMLRQVNYAVSDYLMGLRNLSFASMNGGRSALFQNLADAHFEYERHYNEKEE